MKGCDAYQNGSVFICCTALALRMTWSILLWEQLCTFISARAVQGQRRRWRWIISGWNCRGGISTFRCGGTRTLIYLRFLFRAGGFCFWANPDFVCGRTKSACPTDAEKCLASLSDRTADSEASPFPASAGSKGITHTTFQGKVVCQQGCCSPLLETQSQGDIPLWIPYYFGQQ